jgi:hypothetical protein
MKFGTRELHIKCLNIGEVCDGCDRKGRTFILGENNVFIANTYAYLLTYLRSPYSTVLLVKLADLQLVKESPAFYFRNVSISSDIFISPSILPSA